jgi:hypothetical protein
LWILPLVRVLLSLLVVSIALWIVLTCLLLLLLLLLRLLRLMFFIRLLLLVVTLRLLASSVAWLSPVRRLLRLLLGFLSCSLASVALPFGVALRWRFLGLLLP